LGVFALRFGDDEPSYPGRKRLKPCDLLDNSVNGLNAPIRIQCGRRGEISWQRQAEYAR
jgi:hypothetical protein